jgi:hypothetical protein
MIKSVSSITTPKLLWIMTSAQQRLPRLTDSTPALSVKAFRASLSKSGAPVLLEIFLRQIIAVILGALVVASIIQ